MTHWVLKLALSVMTFTTVSEGVQGIWKLFGGSESPESIGAAVIVGWILGVLAAVKVHSVFELHQASKPTTSTAVGHP